MQALLNLIQITWLIPQYLRLASICIHLMIHYVTQIRKTFIQRLRVNEKACIIEGIPGPILQAASNFTQNNS